MKRKIRGNWRDIYLYHPEIYHKFSLAEDFQNNILTSISKYCSLNDAFVLEIGAGTGRFSLEFAKRGAKVTAIEPCDELAGILKKRIQTFQRQLYCGSIHHVNAYAESINFPPDSFDIAFSSWVLSELNAFDPEDDNSPCDGKKRVEKAISNMRNALRLNGYIWIVETSPGSYFGELQEKLTGKSGDLSHSFTNELVDKYGFNYLDRDVLIKFDTPSEAIDVCNRIFGNKAGALIVQAGLETRMKARLLYWKKLAG